MFLFGSRDAPKAHSPSWRQEEKMYAERLWAAVYLREAAAELEEVFWAAVRSLLSESTASTPEKKNTRTRYYVPKRSEHSMKQNIRSFGDHLINSLGKAQKQTSERGALICMTRDVDVDIACKASLTRRFTCRRFTHTFAHSFSVSAFLHSARWVTVCKLAVCMW